MEEPSVVDAGVDGKGGFICQNHSADTDRARAKGLCLERKNIDVFTP
jgi:hypothetical protein